MKKKLLLYLSIFAFFNAYPTKTTSEWPEYDKNWDDKDSEAYKLFDTSVLAHPIRAQELFCKQYGFKKGNFITPDNYRLECLTRSVENAKATIIVSAGFLPGIMTGMGPLIHMLPKNFNIVFYNNRGKGESEGTLWSSFLWKNLRHYGTHEYQDVIGALNHAQSLNKNNKNKQTFLFGICAGALNTTQALCKLQEQEKLNEYNIRGLIVDSAVIEVQKDMENIPLYKFPGDSFCHKLKRALLWFLRYTIFRRCFMAPEEITTANPKLLAQTKIPTLHIYCEKGDRLTPHESTHAFFEQHQTHSPEYYKKDIQNKCFKESSHACHHLKHKKEYVVTLTGFLKTYFQQN